MANQLISKKVRIGRKGQLTIPKKIRDKSYLKENDILIISETPGGDFLIRRTKEATPEDRMFAILAKIPPFDWKKAWREVKEERRKDA